MDLTKAYDKVNREALFKVLANIGIPPKLVKLIEQLHQGSKAKIRFDDGTLSEPFELNNGLKQGSVYAPVLFNIFFGAIIKAWKKQIKDKGVKWEYVETNVENFLFKNVEEKRKVIKSNNLEIVEFIFQEILFADDAAILSDNLEDLQEMITQLNNITQIFGQQISIKKTEIMVVSRDGNTGMTEIDDGIQIDGKELNKIREFKYVGGIEQSNAKYDQDVQHKINRMIIGYNKLEKSIFSNNNINLPLKVIYFKSLVVSSAMYGIETWNNYVQDIQALESRFFKLLKRMLNLQNKRINYAKLLEWINIKCKSEYLELKKKDREELMLYPLSVTLKERQLLFFGKIIRSQDSDLKKIGLMGNMKLGKRTVGGQYKTYEECIIKDLEDFDLKDTWYEYIQQEASWKSKLKEQKDIAYQKWIALRIVRRRFRHNNRNEDTQNINYEEIRQQTMRKFDKLYKYTLPTKKRHYEKIKMEQRLDTLIHIPATVPMGKVKRMWNS